MPSITMPQLGESVAEGTIGKWLKAPGERIERDEPLVEVITDKVTAEIPSPFAGSRLRDLPWPVRGSRPWRPAGRGPSATSGPDRPPGPAPRPARPGPQPPPPHPHPPAPAAPPPAAPPAHAVQAPAPAPAPP